MSRMARLALATPGNGPDPSPIGLALLAGLTAAGIPTQHFRARACPIGARVIGELTGLPGRHLDAWLMTPDLCRAIFERGVKHSRLALIEGTLDEDCDEPSVLSCGRPGALRPIAEAIDAPIVSVVTCARRRNFHLPRIPAEVDAVLIDGLECPEDFPELRRIFEMVARKPVLGALEALPEVRAQLSGLGAGDHPEPCAIAQATKSFLRFADLAVLKAVARSKPWTSMPSPLPPRSCHKTFRVALAQDDAFAGYFPDSLETLEAMGAELVEFSPLADERLPTGIDLIFIGCGYADQFARDLTSNHSLISALREHVCRGVRLYAEGGGAAYLSRFMVLPDGTELPGAGVIPVAALLRAQPEPPRPVERTLTRDGWLGPSGTVVRGYRSGRWEFFPADEVDDSPGRSGELSTLGDFYFRRNAVGSLIHLHLASLPQVVAAFLGSTPSRVQGS
jgi:cobyrinic acid a,c-diamide synthase